MLPKFETAQVGPQCNYATPRGTNYASLYNLDRELWRLCKRATESRDLVLKQCAVEALNVAREVERKNMECLIYRQFVELELSIYFAKYGTKGE